MPDVPFDVQPVPLLGAVVHAIPMARTGLAALLVVIVIASALNRLVDWKGPCPAMSVRVTPAFSLDSHAFTGSISVLAY
jgi:hypothetical protein